jgi:hypothetical protein
MPGNIHKNILTKKKDGMFNPHRASLDHEAPGLIEVTFVLCLSFFSAQPRVASRHRCA